MERAVALALGDRVEIADLPEEIRMAPAFAATHIEQASRSLADVEKHHILAVLAANGGNQARAAAQLEIGSATLYRKLKSYGHVARRGGAAD